jgi:RNA polymerase sigma-70 factor (ECF subfamily)
MTPASHPATLRIVQLLTRHQLVIHGYALAITADHQLAEDVYQEVAAVVAGDPDGLPPDDEVLPWLREVTRRKALELARRARRGGGLLSVETVELLAGAFEVDEDARGMREALARCVEQLAESHRSILEGRYRENLSAQEIAERASRSVQAVYAVLKRVRRALLRCMRASLADGDGLQEMTS